MPHTRTVTITFNAVPNEMSTEELHYAIMFALREYCAARSPAHIYVAHRYASMSDEFRTSKQRRVQQCLDALEDFDITIK